MTHKQDVVDISVPSGVWTNRLPGVHDTSLLQRQVHIPTKYRFVPIFQDWTGTNIQDVVYIREYISPKRGVVYNSSLSRNWQFVSAFGVLTFPWTQLVKCDSEFREQNHPI